MRLVAVIVGVLGCVLASAFGQEDGSVGELRLELEWPAAASPLKRTNAHLSSLFHPTVVMRRTVDGSVRSRYVLVHSARFEKQMEDAAAAALVDGIAAFLKTGKKQDPGHGVRIVPEGGRDMLVDCGNGVVKQVTPASAEQLATMIRATRKRANAFIGADWALRRDAIRKLEGPVLQGWSISLDLGSVDLPELGGLQRVWWQAWATARSEPSVLLRLKPQDRGAPGPGGVISDAMFEVLGGVPDRLARGKTVRWEDGDQMLRAFPENKAIFYRPDKRKQEDLRISLETGQEAWKILEKRDRMVAWFEKEVEPGLKTLFGKE